MCNRALGWPQDSLRGLGQASEPPRSLHSPCWEPKLRISHLSNYPALFEALLPPASLVPSFSDTHW